MRKTYAQAGLDPAQTRFFEAHGTGTAVGDPIEAGAISEMFTPYRSPEEPLYIGAVKSNIGHSEGAAGIASVIKSIFTLERGVLPANAWFEKRNEKIPDEWYLQFPTKAMPWPQTKTGLRRLSINSFGVSGTNAHVVMDDAFHFLKEHGIVAPHRTVDVPQLCKFQADPLACILCDGQRADIIFYPTADKNTNRTNETNETNATNGSNVTSPPQLFVLSSHDQDGISRLRTAYKQYLPSMSEPLYNLSYTLATKRTHFNWRTAIVANSARELQDALVEKQQITRVAAEIGLAFIFTGQGAQWARMGTELVHYPVFRESLELADAYLKTLGSSWSLIGEWPSLTFRVCRRYYQLLLLPQ